MIKVGDIVRYQEGISSLFQVESISNDIYYGTHCMGGKENSKYVTLATEEEIADFYYYLNYTKENEIE